jgi:hypothetical protein
MLWTINAEAKDKARLSNLELGITVSSMVHPSIGYWWDRTSVRFSGMYLDAGHHAYLIDIGYVFSESENMQHAINILTSRVAARDPGAKYRFSSTGLAYSLNYKGFFFEIGLARPWRDDIGNLENDPVVPCGYWGYIYRFKS